MNKPIGILGGTFDPIHHGHLRMALELYQRLAWQEIRLIPCQQPVLQKKVFASVAQRLRMLQLAIANQPGLVIDDCELTRVTPSYTIDTLIDLRKRFPANPLCLIMGCDALLGLPQWHRWQELLNYAHLVIIQRPAYELPTEGQVAELIQQHCITQTGILQEKLAGALFFAEVAPLAISATNIREQIAQGHSPRYLLPDAVWEYIQQENLYNISSRKN